MKNRFKKHLKALKRSRPETHPDPRRNLLLNRNERVTAHDENTLRLLGEKISKLNLNLYPDLEIFYRKLADWLSLDEEQLYLTEGVSGAIKALLETISGPRDNIVFPVPTFALYPVYCRMFNLELRTAGYTRDYMLDIRALKKAIDNKTAIVFLPNPNVPIEGTLDPEEIASLAGYCAEKGAFLAVDEVYFSFGGPTAAGLIKKFDNIFVIRSFSKAFGLAGIRLGYLIGSGENIEYVSKMRTGYETNTVSAQIASFFMDNHSIVESYIREVKEGLKYLKKELDALGLEHNGGNSSNFLYVKTKNESQALKIKRGLENKNIRVRAGWPEPYSAGLCVTAGPKGAMRKFITELTGILKK